MITRKTVALFLCMMLVALAQVSAAAERTYSLTVSGCWE